MMKSWTAPAEADAGDEPDQPGRVAELRREHRADERAGAGDGGEVMAEEHQPVRRVVVLAVVRLCAGVDARVVERHDPRGDERAVVAVGDRQDAEDRQDDVERAHHSRRSAVGSRQSRSTVTVDSRSRTVAVQVGSVVCRAVYQQSG